MEDSEMDYMGNEKQHKPTHQDKLKFDLTAFELGWRDFILFILSYLVLQFGIIMLAGVIAVLFDLLLGTNLLMYIDEIQYVSILDLIAFVLAMYSFRSVRDFLEGSYNVRVFLKWQAYLYLIGAYLVTYFAQYLIFDVLEWEQAGSQIDLFGLNEIDLGLINIILLVLAFVVIAPVLEETLFRGVIFGFLNKKIGFIGALLISSVIFGSLHPGHQLSTTIMGMVFVLLYTKTKSLWTPILFHLVWNGLATYTLLSYVLAG